MALAGRGPGRPGWRSRRSTRWSRRVPIGGRTGALRTWWRGWWHQPLSGRQRPDRWRRRAQPPAPGRSWLRPAGDERPREAAPRLVVDPTSRGARSRPSSRRSFAPRSASKARVSVTGTIGDRPSVPSDVDGLGRRPRRRPVPDAAETAAPQGGEPPRKTTAPRRRPPRRRERVGPLAPKRRSTRKPAGHGRHRRNTGFGIGRGREQRDGGLRGTRPEAAGDEQGFGDLPPMTRRGRGGDRGPRRRSGRPPARPRPARPSPPERDPHARRPDPGTAGRARRGRLDDPGRGAPRGPARRSRRDRQDHARPRPCGRAHVPRRGRR